ncbi:Cytochrome b561 [hydrothermal vent metagenome]|uniref:Cytochrome b561 n=1 Tax=hydrothermal vent metagenome TaxID=652676 RepID=A0A3B1B3P5_9ZZZZ
MAERIYIFKRFERFWHWSQAALIMFMMLSGFEVHGAYKFFGFENAVAYHTTAAWTLMALWVFAVFWHFTTGEWKQYIPTLDKAEAMFKFYLIGIFTNAPHPFKQTRLHKHNPLQLLAYLLVLVVINPLIWISGWFYLFYSSWQDWGVGWLSLEWVAFFHVLAAFMILIFFIAHIYLATAGHTPTAHIKAMITGWEETD